MLRPLIAVFVSSAAVLGAGTAQAHGVQWAVGIDLPVAAVAVASGGVYLQPPVPVYAPAPVAYVAPRVCAPRVVYAPVPFYGVAYHGWRDGHDRRWDDRRGHDGRWERGDRR